MIRLNIKQNLHIHTVYGDGKDKPEEMILEAINQGFNSIGFSEHTYMPYSSYPYQMTVEDMEDYKNEISALKSKYKNQIDVFCGLEYDMYSDVAVDGFDYLIGSVHYLDFDGEKFGFDRGPKEVSAYIQKHFDGNGLMFAKKYFESLKLLPSVHNFDIIGHFDLLIKNNDTLKFADETSKEYLNYGFEAIHDLKGKIPLFEVNTGAISRGYKKIPYPQMAFLKEFKECGFGAVITSDCHNKDYLDCYYNESRELLLAAGFKTQFILTDKGFTEEKL